MCWDCYDHPKGDPYKIFRQGGVPVEDFDDEIPFRHSPRRVKKKGARAKENRGCPGNNNGEHVYVWTTEFNVEDLFFRFYGFHKYERERCCGCNSRRRGTRLTEEYVKIKERRYRKLTAGGEFNVKRGEPVPMRYRGGIKRLPSYWAYAWENFDEDYQKFRKDYIKMYGRNDYVYGNRYDWWF